MFSNLFSSDRRDAISPFVRELWGAHSAGLVQPASTSAGLLDPAAAQPGAAPSGVSLATAVSPPASGHGTAHGSFQFLRPDSGANQGNWPI
jgi:hypothetical protein